MKFKIIDYDCRSLAFNGMFNITELKAKDKDEAYEILDEETNFPSQAWVLTEEEFKDLKETINK